MAWISASILRAQVISGGTKVAREMKKFFLLAGRIPSFEQEGLEGWGTRFVVEV
jgi:hypothetical protein